MKSYRMKALKRRLERLPCPYCSLETDLLGLLGHALSAHRVNLLARLNRGRTRARGRSRLRFVLIAPPKAPPSREGSQ